MSYQNPLKKSINNLKMDQYNINQMLEELGIRPINNGLHTGVKWIETNGELIESYSPTDGKLIAKVKQATWDDYEALVSRAQEAFLYWRLVPAPKRGEIVRQIGQELRKYKEPLGKLVSYEMGESVSRRPRRSTRDD